MSLPAVSKHLKVLERAGLIARGREAVDWLERYRRFWEQSLDRLDDYLHERQTRPW
jgi:DNA-binding transcriptional ArsR family regulator